MYVFLKWNFTFLHDLDQWCSFKNPSILSFPGSTFRIMSDAKCILTACFSSLVRKILSYRTLRFIPICVGEVVSVWSMSSCSPIALCWSLCCVCFFFGIVLHGSLVWFIFLFGKVTVSEGSNTCVVFGNSGISTDLPVEHASESLTNEQSDVI